MNSYTLEEGRQKAEGRRQKGKKGLKVESFFVTLEEGRQKAEGKSVSPVGCVNEM
ncbi:MAG: hypothetical protein F6K54_23270 [Okeania sp. SIO3B5]|uniref:hypothetical protein n=1 Tax=Okeania sp. SIO3B5 TaxID=2607811 RepID=UPI0013FF4768|nr:hypothetical protein [Okeania sp. SIO3B5]NEO55730.1 hypothetical protein [Okeania sp. SIO3B5]